MDHYEILDISHLASPEEIKAAYETLIRKYRPDKNVLHEAQGLATKINEAYAVLSDPARRREYDLRFRKFKQPVYEEDLQEVQRLEYLRRKRKDEERYFKRMQTVFRVSKIVSFPVLALVSFFLLDNLLPEANLNQKIMTGWRVGITGGDTLTFLRTPILTIEVPKGIHVNYDYDHDPEMPVTFKVSRLRHVLKRVVIKDGRARHEFSVAPSLHTYFSLWPIFVCALTIVLHRKPSTIAFIAGIVQGLFLLILIFEMM